MCERQSVSNLHPGLLAVYSSQPQACPSPAPERQPMIELLNFISYLISLYTYVVIAAVIMSWLIGFNVINPYNPFVRSLWQAVTAVTEPLLKPIRRMLPDMGGLDLSPIVLLLACYFVQSVVLTNFAKLFM
jgi:YggT family protein